MNKTIIININSIVFHIEEDAYETLRSYMIEIKRHFGNSEDSREILEDIENRIAEMFSEQIENGRKEVINREDVDRVITQMGRVSDFESEFSAQQDAEYAGTAGYQPGGNAYTQEASGNAGKDQTPLIMAKKLMRDMDDKVFGGVCSGLGHYFNIESKWVRIIFVLFFLFGGSGMLLYFVLWAVMPKALTRADKLAMRGEQANLQNFKRSFDQEQEERANFTGAGERINRGVRSVGDVISRIFSILFHVIAIAVMAVAGITVLSLFMFFVMNALNIIGYHNPIFFPPLEMLDSTSAFIALVAGTLAVGLPFFALFILMLRLVFKAGKGGMNNYFRMSLWAAWVVSLVVVLYFVVVTNQDFVERSTISLEKPIEKQEHYKLLWNDIRVIKASGDEINQAGSELAKKAGVIGSYLRDDITFRVLPIDSLAAPYIQYDFQAKGRSYSAASDRASEIKYQVHQDGETLTFDSHFMLNEQQLIRDQRVEVNLYLPIGSTLSLSRDIAFRIQGIHEDACRLTEHSRFTEWMMGSEGLECVLESGSVE